VIAAVQKWSYLLDKKSNSLAHFYKSNI